MDAITEEEAPADRALVRAQRVVAFVVLGAFGLLPLLGAMALSFSLRRRTGAYLLVFAALGVAAACGWGTHPRKEARG